MQRMIGRMYWERADHAQSMQHYQQAIAILEPGPETPELARAISSISQMHMLAGEDALAIPWGQRAIAMAEHLGAEDVVVQALNNIGTALACTGGDYEKGTEILRESLQRSLKADLVLDVCRAYDNLGDIQQKKCRYSEARETMQKLYTYAGQVYAKSYVNSSIFQLMWIDWLTGKWQSALTYRSMVTDFTDNLYGLWSKRVFGMIALDLGQIEHGLHLLEESLTSAIRAKDLQTTAPHLGQMVRAYAASGQESKTLEMINQILEFVSGFDQISSDSIMPLFYACQQLAKMSRTIPIGVKSNCLSQLERHALRYQTGEASAALTEARGCLVVETDPAAAAGYFRQAVVDWQSINRPYDQARALSVLGSARAAIGEEQAARQAMKQGSELFNDLSSQLDPQSQAFFWNSPNLQMLHQANSRSIHPLEYAPIRSAVGNRSHTDGLSEREIDVLKLVASGLTNVQIAEHLTLSPLTVNAHLRSIFNKLDVKSRTAAARVAIDRGWA